MPTAVDFSKISYIIITGASQGIGRAIAVEIAKTVNKISTVLLLARSQTGLKETESLMLKENADLNIITTAQDLSKPDIGMFETIIKEPVDQVNNIEQGIIFHNAGHVGTLNPTTELIDLQAWRNYYDLNLFSAVLLNAAFVSEIRKKTKNLIVVNITSLCGKVPFANMSMYGSAKAARDLFFQVLATEEKDIIVLNYSPGPVDTNMVQDIVTNMKDKTVKDQFVSLLETKTILTPEQTVKKMLRILEMGDFKSGSIIDYYNRT
ncbi:sepiapterin reductase [Agrilus planipennis]|uniref:Sepiapterin reductase n=1 Tax=Agrilus planipennis TaxID=224129 RepID=A0A7F5RC40_AGRPL|nr:sepiapterin reductase [Agrilus planipennis]